MAVYTSEEWTFCCSNGPSACKLRVTQLRTVLTLKTQILEVPMTSKSKAFLRSHFDQVTFKLLNLSWSTGDMHEVRQLCPVRLGAVFL
uniref:Uncharacterized protein n=1 Tax=Anguilla anguilla TaxID=7936 RepID=A0A0E9WTM7_ANGAN